MSEQQQELVNVPVWAIGAGLNDRERFTGLEELAADIRAKGLIQPPKYRRLPDGTYQIIAGERRTRAMRDVLGWEEIPALVIECSDEAAYALMGTENRRRCQLGPIEEARGYARGMADYGWSETECADQMGSSVRIVKDRLALLTLCAEVQDIVNTGQFGLGYAAILATSGLDRNWQLRALDLFNANPAPALTWFRAVVSDCIAHAAQAEMFAWGAYATEQKQDISRRLPLPHRDSAPVPVGVPFADVLAAQIAYWRDAATDWAGRGKAREAEMCNGAALTLEALDAARLAALPLEQVTEPQVANMPLNASETVPETLEPRMALYQQAKALLSDGQARSARQIAAALGCDKALVNSVLCREGVGRVRYQRSSFQYSLA